MLRALIVLRVSEKHRPNIEGNIITTIVVYILLIYSNSLESILRDNHDLKIKISKRIYFYYSFGREGLVIFLDLKLQLNIIVTVSRTTTS